MAAARLRIHYCWLIVVTSAVWFIVDIVLFVYFTDCLLPSDRCTQQQQQQQQALTASVTGSQPQRSFFGRLLPGSLYPSLHFVLFIDQLNIIHNFLSCIHSLCLIIFAVLFPG